MAFSHGSKAVFKLDNGAGTLTDISTYIKGVSFSPNADVSEVTVLSKTSKDYIAGLRDATISVDGIFDPSADVILEAALGASSTKSFEYGPAGSASGAIKYTGESICTSYKVDTPVDGPATFTADLQVTAGITRGTYA